MAVPMAGDDEAIEKLVSRGEITPEFEERLLKDTNLQARVDTAFRAASQALIDVTKQLRETEAEQRQRRSSSREGDSNNGVRQSLGALFRKSVNR
jgi:hypothetical protein